MLLLLVFTFSACGEKEPYELAAPQNLKIADEYLTWDAVAHADGYIIYEGENIYEVTEPVLDILELTTEPEKVYSFTVMAIANTGEHGDSALSQPIEYSFADVDEWLTKETKDGKGWIIKPKDGAKLSGKIIIPDQFQDKPVIELQNQAFQGQSELTAVILPDTLKTIAAQAFSDCSNLERVKLSESLECIEIYAFSNCLKLTNIVFPNGLTEIKANAFFDCDRLFSIHIPDSVEVLFSSAFAYCSNITTLSVGVNNLYYRSEENCITTKKDTTTIIIGCAGSTIAEGITKISDNSFLQTNIEKVLIPASVTEIGVSAFGGCPKLQSLQVDPNNKVYYSEKNCIIKRSDPQTVFIGCVGSQIPDTITTIGQRSFVMYAKQTIKIPEGVKVIEEGAFMIGKLTEIEFPSTLEEIKTRAFMDCYHISYIAIPKSVKYLGYQAFANLAGCAILLPAEIPIRENCYPFSGGCTVFTDISEKNQLSPEYGGYIQCYGCTFEYKNNIPELVSILVDSKDYGSRVFWTNDFPGVISPSKKGYEFLGWAKEKDGVAIALSVKQTGYVTDTMLRQVPYDCYGSFLKKDLLLYQEPNTVVRYYAVWKKI